MKIVETILQQIGNLSKPKQKFILALFSTIFIVIGQFNFTNASRYSELCEKTYRRHFSQPFPFMKFNYYLIQEALCETSTKIIAIDCSFIHKSGKSTYGLDHFFNGSVGRTEKGLELSVISVVDVNTHLSYTLSVQQTPPQEPLSCKKNEGAKKRSKKSLKQRTKAREHTESTRIDAYLTQLQKTKPFVPDYLKYLVADGYYSKEKFIKGVLELNFHFIGKLRRDSNLRYLYTRKQKKRGAKRKYDGKVQLTDTSRLIFVEEVEPELFLYTQIVNHISWKQNIRVVYILDRSNPTQLREALLFSSDTELDAIEIYSYYKARFQIEFIFRDAKQFTGLCDSQARSVEKLDFHFNASLTALNIAKYEEYQLHNSDEPFIFSMASYKRRALIDYLLETFISKLDLEPTLIKTHPNYPELLSIGSLAA